MIFLFKTGKGDDYKIVFCSTENPRTVGAKIKAWLRLFSTDSLVMSIGGIKYSQYCFLSEYLGTTKNYVGPGVSYKFCSGDSILKFFEILEQAGPVRKLSYSEKLRPGASVLDILCHLELILPTYSDIFSEIATHPEVKDEEDVINYLRADPRVYSGDVDYYILTEILSRGRQCTLELLI